MREGPFPIGSTASTARSSPGWIVPILRLAIAIVSVWFGALKVLGISPAADLVAATVYVVPAELFVPTLGVWELLIGLRLRYRPLIRVGILLLFLQLPGTFLPIVLFPEVVFTAIPYALTVEGHRQEPGVIGDALSVGGTSRNE